MAQITTGRGKWRGCVWLVALACSGLMGTALLAADPPQPTRPNIIIFYADDLSWAETGCQGNRQIPTPHIDSIAAGGLRCTQGYVAATYCSPSRAGLMTGRYPTRFGHEFNEMARTGGPGLPLSETTLAARLKPLGYSTTCIGKWHLGESAACRPTQRGFDEFFGTLGNTPFFHPERFVDSRISSDVVAIEDPAFYTTDAYADRAVNWLTARGKEPWFLYLPFNAQHKPLEAPQKYLDRFPEIIDPDRKLFAGMMAAMDDAIGRVLAAVKARGEEEETLIFFIGDKGCPRAGTLPTNGSLRGFKAQTYEGGPRVPFLVQWKGRIPAGKTYDLPVMNLDVMPTCLAACGQPVGGGSQIIDGVDLIPYFTGVKSGRPHDTLHWRFGKQWAVRSGDWKLVESHGGSGSPELYNLAEDMGEQHDLAASEPQRMAELQALHKAWNSQQAEPLASPEKKPKQDAAKGKLEPSET